MGIQVFDEKLPWMSAKRFLPGAGTDWLTIVEPNLGGAYRVDSIIVSNNDTTDHVLEIIIDTWSTAPPTRHANAAFTIPAGAGNGVVPAVNLLDPTTSPWPTGIAFDLNFGIWAHVVVAMATDTSLEIISIGGEL